MIKKSLYILSILLLMLSLATGVSAEEARLIAGQGTIQRLRSGQTEWFAVEAGAKLSAGDSLKTLRNSSADIEFQGNIIRLKENSTIQIKNMKQLGLLNGKLLAVLKHLSPGSEFKITSPVAISGVRGTSFSLAIMPDNYTTEIRVAGGEVRFSSKGEIDKFISVGRLNSSLVSPWNIAELETEGKAILSEKILGKKIKSTVPEKSLAITKEEYSSKFGALARITTERAAKIDAYRKLAEIMYGALINSKTTLKDYAVKNDTIRSTVKGVVKGALVTGRQYYSDGKVSIGMKIKAGKIVERLRPVTGDIFGSNYLASPEVIQISNFEDYLEIEKM